MRIGSRTSTARVALVSIASLALAVVPQTLLLISCSSSDSGGDSPRPAQDAGALEAVASDASPDGDANPDPSFHTDPQDLDPARGDPSLDIAGSWIYFDNNQPWIRALFYGNWPPASTFYSWSCSVLLGSANAPVLTYTVQSLNGT